MLAMDMTGEYRLAAPRPKVWAALNDPEILRQSIPGCDEIVKLSDTEMTAKASIKVGPVSAKFGGKVTLSDLDPPNGYKISGEGNGGAAGFAKGGATVKLTDDGTGTLLSYTVDAQVGGKLAQIGSRLIDATARKMAGDFFSRFAAIVDQPAAEPAAPAPATPAPSAAVPEPATAGAKPSAPAAAAPMAAPTQIPAGAIPAGPARSSLSPVIWVVVLAAAVAAIYIFVVR
jgi:uncharacterized protein